MASQQIHVDYKLYKGTGLEPLLFLQLTLPLYQAIWLLITSLHHISYYQSVGDPTGDGFICDDSADPIGCIFSTNMLVADATEAEIASHLAGAQVSADVVAAQAEQGDLAQLAELAQTVNLTKQDAELQGEANAKGTIFTLGAKAAAAHPNAADAQKAIAAALSANATVASAAEDEVTAKCTDAMRQTVQQSNNSGGTAVLLESDGVAACVAAQQAA